MKQWEEALSIKRDEGPENMAWRDEK